MCKLTMSVVKYLVLQTILRLAKIAVSFFKNCNILGITPNPQSDP